LAQALCGFFGFRYLFLEPLLAVPFAGTLCFLGLFNVLTQSILKHKRELDRSFLFWQLSADALAFSFLLILSGGTQNPFAVLFVAFAALGGVILRKPHRFAFLGLLLFLVFCCFKARFWQVLSSDMYVWNWASLSVLLVCVVITYLLVSSLSERHQRALQALERSSQREARTQHLLALGALSAEFAHEFASPLNAFQLRLARLRKKLPTDPDLAAMNQSLEESQKALRKLVGASNDEELFQWEEISFVELGKRAIQKWKEQSLHHSVVFNHNLKTEPKVRVPVALMEKAIGNLLDNAAFTQTPVELELSELPGELQLSVKDRGPGWSLELKTGGPRPHLTNRPGGTGLGLFNCQSLCEVLGGELKLLDNPKGGAVARISFPRQA
jgi:two-component system sensor histidine kinase RegB